MRCSGMRNVFWIPRASMTTGESLKRRAARSRPGTRGRRRTSSRSRSAGWASTDPTPVWCRNISSKNSASPGSKIGRRISTPPAAAASAARSRVRSTSSISSCSMTISSSRRGTMSSPGASSPQRDSDEPQVERAGVAHEGAVLVPGAADRRARPCAASSCAPRAARARRGSPRPAAAARPARRVEHPGRERRRVGREHAAALLDPRPLGDLVAAPRARTPRRGRLGRAGPRRAPPNARSIPAASSSAVVARHEPAHEQAAVAQDPGAQQPGRQVGRRDLGQRRRPAARPRRARRSPARRSPASSQAHPGAGGGAAAAALGLRSLGSRPPLPAQAADLVEHVLGLAAARRRRRVRGRTCA